MTDKEILISEATLYKIKNYYDFLNDDGLEQAGAYFKNQIQRSGMSFYKMSLDNFTRLLIQSEQESEQRQATLQMT